MHAVPLAAALVRRFGNPEIDWLVEKRWAELPAMVAGVRPVSAEWSAGTVRHLRTRAYDLVIDAQGLWRSAVWSRLAQGGRTIGFAREGTKEKGAQWLYTEQVSAPTDCHVIRKNMALGAAVGADSERIEFPMYAGPLPDEEVSSLRSVLGSREGYAVLVPASSRPSATWPAQFGAVLACDIRSRLGIRTVVPAPAKDQRIHQILESSDGACVFLRTASLRLLSHLLAGARVVIGPDTGPTHLAAALGSPVVGLYGPNYSWRNGPWGNLELVASVESSCRCFYRRVCRHRPWCMLSLTPQVVLSQVLLAARATKHR